MTNTTATPTHPLTEDPRFNESGTMAYREIKNLLREHLGDEVAASLGLQSGGLANQGWRPSDALRHVTRAYLATLSA